MKKIKLLHIQVLPILAGAQRISLNILRNLDKDKYDKWLICAPDNTGRDKSLITEAEKIGIKVITLNCLKREIGFHDIRAFIKIYKICKQEKFDIVHTQSSKPGILGRLASKISGCKKTIHTVQGHSFHKYEKPWNRIFFLILEIITGLFSDKIVLVNHYYKKDFWFIPSKKISVIYNAVDFTKLKEKHERKDDLIKLIFVGRLDKAKSPVDFLKAINIVVKKYDNVRATIVGDGEYYSEMKRFILEHNMENVISLLGWRSDVPALLAEHDIFCLTSIYEAFGLVFCEAGYTGLPSVATNVEGIPEVVVNNKTGILVPPKQPVLFAEAIIKLIKNRRLASDMGKSAKIYVSKNFGLSNMIERYKELYEL